MLILGYIFTIKRCKLLPGSKVPIQM
ncbi:hypothetical protein TRIP_E350021 [uncultured Spirochaetota bacterium]|uniref:Uncharacterized protein n=1 Tax=uncultured Spirochaetota bacterium TaxID=460511 RepID=A0A652ZY68_9SPIR|nr:hypothetical protein TRIP_E350021 [uncultured Spirochaetota bacterium]